MITSICGYSADSLAKSVFYASETSIYGEISRRISKTELLDGGIAFQDYGQVFGDLSFDISTQFSESLINILQYIAKNHFLVTLSSVNGVFLGAIESVKPTSTTIGIRFSVKSKISEA